MSVSPPEALSVGSVVLSCYGVLDPFGSSNPPLPLGNKGLLVLLRVPHC